MEAFGEPVLNISLFDTCGGQVIVVVTEKVIRDKAVEKRVHDELASNGRVIRVMGARVETLVYAVRADPVRKNTKVWDANPSIKH